jgi:transposase
MLQIHPNARTTPVTRAEIARSHERTGVLAQRYGVSSETIRKWRKRGAADCLDHSARPHHLPWKASDEERAIVCTLRRLSNFALDDLTFIIRHFLPHLNRDSIWRILKAEGLNRRAKPAPTQPAKGQGSFKDYELGFVHIDIKHLPKLQTADGERRTRYLYVAIDRCSRSVDLAVKDDETEASAIARSRCGFSLSPDPCTDRQRKLLHPGLCQDLCRTGCPVSPHQTTLAADQRYGRALQRPDRQRSPCHHDLLARSARAAPTRLQRCL